MMRMIRRDHREVAANQSAVISSKLHDELELCCFLGLQPPAGGDTDDGDDADADDAADANAAVTLRSARGAL